MSVASDAYLKALRRARAVGYELTAEGLARFNAALNTAAKAIVAQLAGAGPLQAARLDSLLAQALGVLEQLEVRAAAITGQTVRVTIDEVLGIHEQVTQQLAQKYLGQSLPGLGARLDVLPVRALAVVASRPGGTAHTFRTLIGRHFEEAAPALDTLLQSGLVRGVSIDRLARDVADLLTAPADVDLGPYGLVPNDVSGLGTIASDARRIAASETLNALREANAQAMDESPLVIGTAWQLSGRHDGLRSSPDECDVLAESDFYGLGPGIYPPDKWPQAPHPYCGCTQGDVILRPPSEWGRSKPRSPGRQLAVADMDLSSRGFTEQREQRARRTVGRSLQVR